MSRVVLMLLVSVLAGAIGAGLVIALAYGVRWAGFL
jgi:hypothetical protein